MAYVDVSATGIIGYPEDQSDPNFTEDEKIGTIRDDGAGNTNFDTATSGAGGTGTARGNNFYILG